MSKLRRVGVRLSDDVRAAVRRAAYLEGVSVSAYAREAVAAYLRARARGLGGRPGEHASPRGAA